ncbi:MAG: YraN family protein [Chloroflexia bacterium]
MKATARSSTPRPSRAWVCCLYIAAASPLSRRCSLRSKILPVPPEDATRARARKSAATGRDGEELAARYLTRQGCTILARNWRAGSGHGEVDIIAECPAHQPETSDATRELAFVEIRTRHGRPGLAEESLSRRKAASMATAAYAYLAAQNLDPERTFWRIDLLAISKSGSATTINWIKSAISEDMITPY